MNIKKIKLQKALFFLNTLAKNILPRTKEGGTLGLPGLPGLPMLTRDWEGTGNDVKTIMQY